MHYAQRMLATDSGAGSAGGDEDDALLLDPAAPRGQPTMKEMPILAGLRIIAEIYSEKYNGDLECELLGLPRQSLPDVARGYFLRLAGSRSVGRQRLKDFLLSVGRWSERYARCRVFAHLVGAAGDDDWDAAAACFILDVVAAAVPPSVLAERLAAPAPCISAADCIAATEAAITTSKYSWPSPAGHLISEVSLLAAGSPRGDHIATTRPSGDDHGGLVLLDDWVDVLLRDWRHKWRVCKEQTMRLVEERLREQTGRAGDRAFSLSRFTSMVREMEPSMSDFQVLHISFFESKNHSK